VAILRVRVAGKCRPCLCTSFTPCERKERKSYVLRLVPSTLQGANVYGKCY
jgi:hypothetical protein